MILMRYQAARDLGVGFRGEHRLAAFASITAPNAADIKRGPAAVALQRGVALLATHFSHVDGPLVAIFVEGNAGYHLALFFGELFHVIVEARHGDAAISICHLTDQTAEFVDGIGYRSAKVSAVQVAVGASDFNLPIGQTTQTGG